MSDTTINTVRVTKAQKYSAIIALLEGKSAVTIPGKDDKQGVTLDAAYLCDFIRNELELLNKKNQAGSNGAKKLTKAQEKNEEYKAVILRYLAENPTLIVTATDIMEKLLRSAYPNEVWSNQKVAALMNAMADKYDADGVLVAEGKLTRTQGKGKVRTTFQIKPEYLTLADDSEA